MKKKQRERALALLLAIVIVCAVAATYFATRNTSAQTGTWQLRNQISGAGTQATAEFTMNSNWRTAWTIEKKTFNLFIVTIYAKTEGKYAPVAEADESDTNATQGILQMNSTGIFMVRVVAVSDTAWSLRIEEFVKP